MKWLPSRLPRSTTLSPHSHSSSVLAVKRILDWTLVRSDMDGRHLPPPPPYASPYDQQSQRDHQHDYTSSMPGQELGNLEGSVHRSAPPGFMMAENTLPWNGAVSGENQRNVADIQSPPPGLGLAQIDMGHDVNNLESSLRNLLLRNQEADNALMSRGTKAGDNVGMGNNGTGRPTGPDQYQYQYANRPLQPSFRGHSNYHQHQNQQYAHNHRNQQQGRGFGRRGNHHGYGPPPPPLPGRDQPDFQRQYDPRFSGQDANDFPPLGAPAQHSPAPQAPILHSGPPMPTIQHGSFRRGRGMNLDYAFNTPVQQQQNRAGRGHPRYFSNGPRGGNRNLDGGASRGNERQTRGRGRGDGQRGRGLSHEAFGDSPPTPITKGPYVTNYDYVRDIVLAEVKRNDPLPEEERNKVKLLAQLQKLCEVVVPGCRVVPFGSLVTGFAGKKADFDLLIIHDTLQPPLDSAQSRAPVFLAGEFLRRGFDKVALLTKTRVPILKITTPEHNGTKQDKWAKELSDHFQEKVVPMRSRSPSANSTASDASFEVETHDDEEWPPGISCDIGFTKHLGIRNSEMLKTYSLCDPRVRQLVMFVKSWAKRRNINSAYRGTLSSYGYVLLALHFLINVTQPPILPNLQLMAPRPGTPQYEITSPEGFDIYFFNDRAELAKLVANNAITINKLSIGQLINDFFDYYSHTFKWHTEVVSLRTRGGILSKQEKGWTSAVQRTSKLQGNYKDRYLIGIEDPFEITHNVGRPCFDSGAQAVKIEFQRASAIMNELTHIDPENPSVFAIPQPDTGAVVAVDSKDNGNDINTDVNVDIDETNITTTDADTDIELASSSLPPTTATTQAAPSPSLQQSEPQAKPQPKTLEEAYAFTMDKLLEPRGITEEFVREEKERVEKERRVLVKMVRQGVTTGEMKAMMITAAAVAREARDSNHNINNNNNNSSSSRGPRITRVLNRTLADRRKSGSSDGSNGGKHRQNEGGTNDKEVEIDLEKFRNQVHDF